MPQFSFPPHCASRFEAERLIGEGGFGSVWLAHQKGLDRFVAIKFIRTDVGADADSIERFKNEALVTASLQHPSIVRVIDHDVEDGVPWIAYEYLPGRSLAEVLASGPLSWAEALKVGQQIAGALEEAHSKGVIHRDIKPENVLEVEAGRYKLADFGIAKWTAASHIKTRTGFMMGTPTHVPPEQIRGDPPSPQGDVYALGVLIYQMLTGRLPFEDENILNLLRAHLETKVTTPSKLQAGLPREVDELVKRALDKAPSGRFADGAELRKAIEDVQARPATTDDVARPAPEGAPPALAPMNTSRTRLPRPSTRTRAVSRVDVVAPPPAVSGLGRFAVAGGIFVAGLAAMFVLFGRPAVQPPPRSPSVTVAPRPKLDRAEIAAGLEPVRAAIRAFDDLDKGDRDPVTGSRFPLDAKTAGPHLERALRLTLESLQRMQAAQFEGPAWAEDMVLQTDQVLQRAQKLEARDRRGAVGTLLESLDEACGRVSSDPWRRALAYTVHARMVQLKSGSESQEAVDQFLMGLNVLNRETPQAWTRSLRGLKVRLTVAYQTASSVERANNLKMVSARTEGVPAVVANAWEVGLSMAPDLDSQYAGVTEVTDTAEDYWEVHWQLFRTAEKVIKIVGFPRPMRERALHVLARIVDRTTRIKAPPHIYMERDRRFRGLTTTLKDKELTLTLPDGSTWPPGK